MCQLCIVKSLELDIQALTSHQSFVTKYSGSFTMGLTVTLCVHPKSETKKKTAQSFHIVAGHTFGPYICYSNAAILQKFLGLLDRNIGLILQS